MSIQELNNFTVPENFRGRNKIIVQIWFIVQSTFFAWSPHPFYNYRRFLLRLFGAKIGKGVKVRSSCRITYPWKVCIGDYSWIGEDVVLYSLGDIEIGQNVVISQKSYICTGGHDYQSNYFEMFAKKILIKDYVWIATDVYVAPGITIGEGSVAFR